MSPVWKGTGAAAELEVANKRPSFPLTELILRWSPTELRLWLLSQEATLIRAAALHHAASPVALLLNQDQWKNLFLPREHKPGKAVKASGCLEFSTANSGGSPSPPKHTCQFIYST